MAAAHGLEVEEENIVANYGSGADIAGRPGLTALLNEAEDGKVGTLVTTSLDRLARNLTAASCIADALRTQGVTVVTASSVFTTWPEPRMRRSGAGVSEGGMQGVWLTVAEV